MNNELEEKIKIKKEFLKKQTLDEDIKKKIKQTMKEQYNKKANFSKLKYKRITGIVACLFLISTIVFAKNIDDFINLFANTQINNNQIINPNSIIKLDSEYVVCNEIGINISYMYEEDEYLYIVLNVIGIEDKIDDIIIDKLKIMDLSNNNTYSYNEFTNEDNFNVSVQYKKDYEMIFIKIKKHSDINLIKKLEIEIENLTIIGKNDDSIIGKWELKTKRP